MADDQASPGWRTALIVSAASFFVPTFVAYVRQPLVVAAFFSAVATASTFYHAYEERDESLADLDFLYANALLFVAWLRLAVDAYLFGFFSRRVWLPIIPAAVALGFYMVNGTISCDTQTPGCRPEEYNRNHVIWHFLVSIAAIPQAWYSWDIRLLCRLSGGDIVRKPRSLCARWDRLLPWLFREDMEGIVAADVATREADERDRELLERRDRARRKHTALPQQWQQRPPGSHLLYFSLQQQQAPV